MDNNLKVKLNNTDRINGEIYDAIVAMRTCYKSNHLMDSTIGEFGHYAIGEGDFKLLKNGVKRGHLTPMEFITLKIGISGLTRAILQEVARHRTQTLNVQSTRYTIKKMKEDIIENMEKYFYIDLPHYGKFIEMIVDFIDNYGLWDLPNDKLKFYFPESLRCDLEMKVDLRNFFNFFKLRSSKAAHFLIQELAGKMYEELPQILKDLVDIDIERGNA